MIYKNMTIEEWNNWKARVDAFLLTDIKEYNHGISLLAEASSDRSLISQFEWGDPASYIFTLKKVLSRVRNMTNYPRLISKDHPVKPLYIASVPVVTSSDQIPGVPPTKPIEPLATPEAWNRYMSFDSYKESLSPELQKEGDNMIDWFTNRRRLHDYAKNLERTGADKDSIKKTVEELDAQSDRIEDFFNRVQSYIEGKSLPKINKYKDAKASGNYTKSEIEEMKEFDAVCAALSKEKRIETNRKFISRKDLKKPKDPEELALRIRELQEWEVPVPQVDEEEYKESYND